MGKFMIFMIFMFAGNVIASDIKIDNDCMHINGFLNQEKFDEFKNLLNANSTIKKIIFEKSLGGTEAVAYQFVKIIKEKELDTEVNWQCHSACALAFLAGKRRTFSGRFLLPTAVMLHMARTSDNREGARNEKLFDLLNELTNNKIEEPIRSLIRKSWKEAAGVIFYARDFGFMKTYRTVYCDGSQGTDISQCKELEGVDPLRFGILTE